MANLWFSGRRCFLVALLFALAAGVPEAGEAAQSEPVAASDRQRVADHYAHGLTPGGTPRGIPVRELIWRADDEMEAYSTYWSARSSDTSVVTVRLARSGEPVPARRQYLHVWIWPVGNGEATVTVDYTAGGSSVSADFTVTVADPDDDGGDDDPPDTFDPVAWPDPQNIAGNMSNLRVGGSPGQIWVRQLINANDQMAAWSAYWSAESSDTRVVTVVLGREAEIVPWPNRPELQLWVWPEGNGEASVTLSYSRHGKSATTKFTVRVVGAPPAGGPVGPVTNVQANVQDVVNDEVEQAGGLEPGGDAVDIDVNKLFSNVGSGATGRDFSARTSDRRVVTVRVTDNPHVVITPVGAGAASITVGYAGGGSAVSASFDVEVGDAPPPPPSQVTGVRVSALHRGLRVSWEAATGEVSRYRVDVADGDGRSRRVHTDADVLEALVEGLVNGVEYTVTVTALTGDPDVEGPASEPQTATPQTPPPSQVTGVRVSALDGGVRVSWEAATGEVSQYRVHIEDGDGWFRRVHTDADVLEALVERLVNGVEHTITVTALTDDPGVEGPASEPQTATPLATVPALPLAGAGILAGLLAAGAARRRRASD